MVIKRRVVGVVEKKFERAGEKMQKRERERESMK